MLENADYLSCAAADSSADSIMVLLIVRIEGIEGTANPLVGLLTLLSPPRLVWLPLLTPLLDSSARVACPPEQKRPTKEQKRPTKEQKDILIVPRLDRNPI